MRNVCQHPTILRAAAIASILAFCAAVLWIAEPRVAGLWLNTAALACGAAAIALPFGTLLAVILFKTDVPCRRPALMLLVGMLFVPLYVVTGAWDAGFGIQGWHTLVTNPHLAHTPWLAGWRAAIWVHGLAAAPWTVLIVGAGLRTVEPEVEEDAATCAPPLSVLWHITLPRILPAIGVAALWLATVVLTEISVTDFFQVRTFAEEVYTQSALGTLEQGAGYGGQGTGDGRWIIHGVGLWSGVALSAILAVLAMLATARLFIDWSETSHRSPWFSKLRAARWPTAAVLALCMALLAGIPLANLAYKAGIQVAMTESGRVRAWSLWQLITRLASTPKQFLGELTLSCEIGSAAATAAVLFGLLISWSWRNTRSGDAIWRPTPLRIAALAIIALCLTLPGPLLGLGVISLLNQPPSSPLSILATLYDSNFSPWLVQSIRTLPIATLILWPALASVPQVMLDTAATDGTGHWGQLFRIAVPQRWAAIVAAWLVAFAVAIGELAATILVMPPQLGATALSIQIFQLLHYGVDDRIAAICLMLVALIAALTGISTKLMTNDE